uniref:Piwi domain-containing protein n=1 Tax=Panagrolaimus sp. PS1159 TaxID=55785 RepID=A0AC35EV97_9BILA
MTMPTNSNRFDTDIKQLEPVCVGYAATVDGKANVMSGGYFFQTSRNAIVHGERLGERVIDSMKTFSLKSQSYPKQIILYRSGASEGQFLDIKKNECDVMKRTVHKYCNDAQIPPPNFVVIAVQKKTNHRLFKTADELSQLNERTPAFAQNIGKFLQQTSVFPNPPFFDSDSDSFDQA